MTAEYKIIEYRNKKGMLHRTSGPAWISDDGETWWMNGVLHRIDGPAIDYPGHKEWYVNGNRIQLRKTSIKYLLIEGNNE